MASSVSSYVTATNTLPAFSLSRPRINSNFLNRKTVLTSPFTRNKLASLTFSKKNVAADVTPRFHISAAVVTPLDPASIPSTKIDDDYFNDRIRLADYQSKLLSSEEIDALSRVDFDEITQAKHGDDFLFGAGTSAYQVEGAYVADGKGLSVWDAMALSTPGVVFKDGSNGNVACDMYHKYKEDIKMMKKMGMNSYRFSIAWPRILPGGRMCHGVNQAGIDYYNDVINTCLENGLTPFVTLFHWDTPDVLEKEYGGLLDRKIVDDFRDFAKICFWEFGDRVKHWCTLNEPWSYTTKGYLTGAFNLPPGKDLDITGATVIAGRNLSLAHSAASKLYKTFFQEAQGGQIGITLNSHWYLPRDAKEANEKAAKRTVDYMLGWFLEPALYGHFPESFVTGKIKTILEKELNEALKESSPVRTLTEAELKNGFLEEETKELIGSIDFLGLNYYSASYVQAGVDKKEKDITYYQCRDSTEDAVREVDGKTTYQVEGSSWMNNAPWGLYDKLKFLSKYPGMPPIYITENGISTENKTGSTCRDACKDGETRLKYHKEHLAYIHKAMKDGVDVRGYYAWAWCDNLEWMDGYTSRFGLVYVDFLNNLDRLPKESALWFSNFLKKSDE